jgi:ABC-2 type transport system ATP-binding protein
MSIIDVTALKKNYGSFRALDGIDLTVGAGEVFGFIGPNGAGKSTTIRILLGLLKKDGGQAKIFDGDVWQDASALHKRLAYVPSDINLWPTLTGGEVIDLLARLRGKLDMNRKAELLERFQLNPTKKCKTYSKGNRQKVAIISAFVSDVDLLILDEPTSGLDPLMELQFQECIQIAKREGKTVFLSSHILSEVEKLCDRISIIKDGRIVESGSMAQLRHLTRTLFTVETVRPVPGNELTNMAGVHEVKNVDGTLTFSVDPDALDSVMKKITDFGLTRIYSAPPTLEELFMRHYKS